MQKVQNRFGNVVDNTVLSKTDTDLFNPNPKMLVIIRPFSSDLTKTNPKMLVIIRPFNSDLTKT